MKSKIIICLLFIGFAALFLFSSCRKEETAVLQSKVLEKNLLKSGSKYSEALSQRGSGEVIFSIEDIKREGDSMKINVKGGCSSDDYLVIWDGVILESYPMQIRLVLVNESGNTSCDASNKYTLKVNLAKLIGKQKPEDYIIHVANGSVKEDKSLNPDGSVTLH